MKIVSFFYLLQSFSYHCFFNMYSFSFSMSSFDIDIQVEQDNPATMIGFQSPSVNSVSFDSSEDLF